MGYGERVYQVVVRKDGEEATDMYKHEEGPFTVGQLLKLPHLGSVKVTEIVAEPGEGGAGKVYAERVNDPLRPS
jgi:hypothetical protein